MDMLSLIVGIVSSLVATALFIGGSELIRRVVLPWYEDKIYRGVRIDGVWDAFEFAGKPIDAPMLMSLTQHGDSISGTYSHENKQGDVDLYRLSGTIRDGYFLATMVPKSNRQLDGGSLLMFIYNKREDLLMIGALLSCGDAGKVNTAENITFRWRKA